MEATNRLAFLVHAQYPEVLIEMHDQMLGGTSLRYVPTYYGYGKRQGEAAASGTHGFDTVWAFELMWESHDRPGGRAQHRALLLQSGLFLASLHSHRPAKRQRPVPDVLVERLHVPASRESEEPTPTPPSARLRRRPWRLTGDSNPSSRQASFTGSTKWCTCTFIPQNQPPSSTASTSKASPPPGTLKFAPSRFGLDGTKEYKAIGATASRQGELYLLDVVGPRLWPFAGGNALSVGSFRISATEQHLERGIRS